MFERYTDTARRAIFFARYEACQHGSPHIENEHLLLGVLREDRALTDRFLRSHVSVEEIRNQIERRHTTREKISTSVDVPFSIETKRVLFNASEEAHRLDHRHISTEHFLLALLREESSYTAKLLTGFGIQLDSLRDELSRAPHTPPPALPPQAPPQRSTPVHVSHVQGFTTHVLRPHPQRPTEIALLRSIRRWIVLFLLGLVLSGITAFPLVHETSWLVRAADAVALPQHLPALYAWLVRVSTALADTSSRYPFLAYGTDWLAFGHLVIAAAFVGPWRDPLRNRWLIDVGLLACGGVVILAFTAGPIRGIPIYWRLIDSSFGLCGAIPLLIVRHKIDLLEAIP